jgi:hypothetical protein
MIVYCFTPIKYDDAIKDLKQICQIINNDLVITIDYNTDKGIVAIDRGSKQFYLTSPEIENMTLRNIFDALGFSNKLFDIDFVCECNYEDKNRFLDLKVFDVPLCQIYIISENNRENRNTNTNNFDYIYYLLGIILLIISLLILILLF